MKYQILPVAVILLIAQFSSATETLDKLMTQWLSLESQRGNLESDWRDDRLMLERRLQLYDREMEVLQEKVDKAQSTRDSVDQRRAELIEKQEKLELEQVDAKKYLEIAEAHIEALSPRLPPPLQSQWQEKKSLLADDSASDSEKLERVFVMLKMADEFDSRIAINRSSMTIPDSQDSTKIIVTQIYLGLSQGWYISDGGKYRGYGRATLTGWLWWHGDDAENELGYALDSVKLLQLREILENPVLAAYMTLPIKLQHRN